jgi:putative transposase
MAWHQRLCGEDLYHHIYAWGNNRNPIFSYNHHYTYYLHLLADYADRFQIDIIAYALMEWHVHLFIYDKNNSMAEFMQALHRRHASYHNIETNRVGHAFGERYNNKIIQPNTYALNLSRYIHRQAVEARLVKDPSEYKWTSYNKYTGLEPYDFVKPYIILNQFGDNTSLTSRIRQYADYVNGNIKSPVDWDMNNYNVVGDGPFYLYVKNLNKGKRRVTIKSHDIMKIICLDLNIELDNLLHPSGRDERILRHKAFYLMLDKYGYSVSDIARIFKVTRLSVMKGIAKYK